jgi:hypothetical protein
MGVEMRLTGAVELVFERRRHQPRAGYHPSRGPSSPEYQEPALEITYQVVDG